jgi:hypothetical protein
MNIQKLNEAEERFLEAYPTGFMHPEMQALGKKHKMEQMIALAQECFTKSRFSDARCLARDMVQIVNRSSMVSLFEKPKVRDGVAAMNDKQLQSLARGMKNFLHGNQQKGFEELVATLKPLKLAKWTLITVAPNYYWPNDEVFIKPTTVKGVIEHFELQGLVYSPQPTWPFYAAYRQAILKMKSLVDGSLVPSNAAFGGFLMMSLEAVQYGAIEQEGVDHATS